MIDEDTAVSAELRNYFGPDVVIGIVEIRTPALLLARVVPVGSPDLPMDRFIAQPGNVPVVDFRDLQWDELEREAIEVELLEQEFGPRFRKTSKRTVLNLQFWAKFLVKQLNLRGLQEITFTF